MSALLNPTTTETVSGVFIDVADPNPDHIKIEDIAWALSRQSRYAGHTMCRIPYSVGQHTVVVSKYVEQALTPGTHLNWVFIEFLTDKMNTSQTSTENEKWLSYRERARKMPEHERQVFAFHGLMHDFAEAYLVDLPTPVKRLPGVYEAYKKYELQMDGIIYEKFGLAYSKTRDTTDWDFGLTVVGWADMYALLVEAYHFLPSRGIDWGIPLPRPYLSELYGFRWPIPNIEAFEELLARYEELRPKGEHE